MGSQLIATTRDITASALGPKKLGLHKHPSVQQVVNNVAVVFMSFREIDGFVKVVAFRESLHSSNDRIGCGMQQIGRAPCRERVCQSVSISVGGGSLKKNNQRSRYALTHKDTHTK